MFIDRCVPAQHNVSTWLRGRLPSRLVRILPVVGCFWALIALTVLPSHLTASETARLSTGPVVAVASSFRALWPSLIDSYQADTGEAQPRASFASSGLLSTQILHGAPFELFLSADLATVERLVVGEKAQNTGVTLAYGGISLLARRDRDTPLGLTLDTLRTALQEPGVKLAMPNPRHAPYGNAAQQALNAAGLWPLLPGVLLSGENASQSVQFAQSGAAAFAIVPTTLVTPTPDNLSTSPLPTTLYQAVDHRAVLLDASGESAAVFLQWLTGDAAKAVFEQFGLSTQP